MDITKILSQIRVNKSSSQPIYLQVAAFLAEHIKENLLPAGTKLPPERLLAEMLGVSRTTAINIYRQLAQEGLVSIKVGSGTYVIGCLAKTETPLPPIPWEQLFVPHLKNPLSSILKDLLTGCSNPNNISLAAGMPDPSLYPLKIFEQLFNKYIKNLSPLDLGHLPTEGYPPLRRAIANLHLAKGINVPEDNILITAGSQQGLYLVNKVLLEPKEYVIVEEPTYIGAIQVFQHSGARILTVPRLTELPLSILEDYLIRYRPKLFYIIPSFQNPTGHVLSLQQRQDLLKLAARYQLVIVEDDAYGELYYDQKPLPSLKALDQYGVVIYLGTFSKTIFPGLRTGWLTGPPVLIKRLSQEKQYLDLHCNNVCQWLLTTFLQEGVFDNHLQTVRQEYKKRRDIMANSIDRFCPDMLTYTLPQGGFYFWCQLPNGITSPSLLHETNKIGLTFVPGEAFYTNNLGSNKIRLCFSTQSEEQLVEAIKRLGKALKSLTKRSENLSVQVNSNQGIPII